MFKLQEDALRIFKAGLKAVTPYTLVSHKLNVNKDKLFIDDCKYHLNHNIHVVAFGKAVLGMVYAVEHKLSAHIVQGIASVPYSIGLTQELMQHVSYTEKVEIIEGAKDNLPDKNAQVAAEKILEVASALGYGDILLVLMSGGGSALLPLPVSKITLEEKLETTKVLSKKGANIVELNTIRKHLSRIKGGKLAQVAYPASVITLILSDVLHDPLDIIACGPTVPNLSTKRDCLNIIEKLNAADELPINVMKYLVSEEENANRVGFSHVYNTIIGNNINAVDGASLMAQELGYEVKVFDTCINGEAREIGCLYAKLGERNSSNALPDEKSKPLCIIGSGETIVFVRGDGKGGRNQELALAAAIEMNHLSKFERNLLLLSAGTDGQDGPTPVAGAYAFQNLIPMAIEEGLEPLTYLNNNDTYSFYKLFKNGTYLIETGLTGTNVMDLQIMLIS